MSPGSSRKSSDSDSKRDHREKYSNLDDISTHTNNPKLKEARIFVGNVTFPRVTQADLEEKFSKYGKILGISVHRGFAFVQFERGSVAEKAIKGEHFTMFKGVKIDVKTAATSDDMRSNGRSRSRNHRSISPKHPRDHHSREGSRDIDDRDWDRRNAGRDRSPFNKRDYFDDRFRDSYKREMNYRYPQDMPPYGFPEERSLHRPFEEETPREPFRDDVLDPNRPNDCEIIVVLKHLRAYGESVERRLKNLGLTVDLLFLKDEAALLPTIDDIARRGSLFAIVIADQNEAHRSVTLNILHGTPQEHRNMPLDDAMKLVAINYHEYVQSIRDKKMRGLQGTSSGERPPAVADPGASAAIANVSSGRSPKLQNLLNLLNDGKYLTSAELGVVIEYLTQQRNEILARERGDHLQENIQGQNFPLSSEAHSAASNSAQAGNIPSANEYGGQQSTPANWQYDASGNAPSISQVPAVAPVQEQQSSSRGTNSFLNFDNPTVQRALDSLIQSGPNLLQKVLGSNEQSSDRNEKGRNPAGYNQGSQSMGGNSVMNQDDHQPMMRNQVPGGSHSQSMRDQYASSQNVPSNYGSVQKQEDHYMQRQGQYSQNQRQYLQNDGYNNTAPESDRNAGIRHPLLGTPVSNRFSSSGMGRSGMQRPQKRDNFY